MEPSRSSLTTFNPAMVEAAVAERGSIGNVVEIVGLLCMAIPLKPKEEEKNKGKTQDAVGELLGATIRTGSEDERGVRACECAEALGKASASLFQSV